MDQTSATAFEGEGDVEFMGDSHNMSKATVATPNSLFVSPIWGAETAFSTATFTPGIYLHDRDPAYGYMDPLDTTGLTDWANSIPGEMESTRISTVTTLPLQNQFLSTAPPSKEHHTGWAMSTTDQLQPGSSSASASSYAKINDVPATLPSIMPDQTRVSAPAFSKSGTAGPVRPSRVAKSKSKLAVGSTQPSRNNSGNITSSSSLVQYVTAMDDKHQTNSAGSSCESPPFDELSHRRSRTGSNFSSSGDSGGSANGLMTTGHGGNHNVTLRTASRKPKSQPTASINASTSTVTGTKENGNPKTDSPTSELPGAAASSLSPDGDSGNTDGLITEEHRARQNHNIVEKQYRNRLNSQFERLLSILPANQMEGADTGKSVDFDERRMSKAEVLDLARRRIHALESEIKQLYADRDNLRNNVATLNLAIRNGQRPQQQQPQQQQRLSIAI